jgi:hypothetical protein
MKICYLDAFSGLSGDMLVGALASAGADETAIVEGLESLQTGARFRFDRVVRRGIGAHKFVVEAAHAHGHHHRHLGDILRMIDSASLSDGVKRDASAIFRRLGEAEAAVHQVPIEKVHFHEVGAVDSIADIVGAALGFHLLGSERIVCSPVNVGSGTVKTEHGLLPVPAPATAALLKDRPVYASGPQMELTTPTGAAVATTLAAEFGALPPMRILATGYGAGDRDFTEQANVLRILVGEATGAAESTTVAVIEANIDDATPELLGHAMDRLLEAGALDVTISPVLMKKNRPGSLVRVIATPQDRERLAQLIFAETTTLGLRIYTAERRVEARRLAEVETPHGTVRVKVSDSGNFAPEFEDCRRLAISSGVPLKQILAEANHAYMKKVR